MVRSWRDPPGIHVFEFYPHIPWVPIACVLAGALLFAARGLLAQVGRGGNARHMFVCQWRDRLSVDPRQPLQTNECLDISQLDPDEDRLLILRPTLMNPSLIDQENGINPVGCHFDFRDRGVRSLLDPTGIKP